MRACLKSHFAAFWLLLSASTCFGKLYITVSGADVRKAKLALGSVHTLPGFTGAVDTGVRLSAQIRGDLELSGLFDFVDYSSFANFDKAADLYQVDYKSVALTGATFLLKLGFKVEPDTSIVLEAFLYDLVEQKKIFGTRYQAKAAEYSQLAHALTEDILKNLTGEKGLFDSRILMVCRSLQAKKEGKIAKEIYVSDPDGQNLTQLTTDQTLSLSPKWSPDGKTITYTQFQIRRVGKHNQILPVIKKHNLTTGERRIISERKGLNTGAAWSPSGDKIAATLSFTGRPELYLLDQEGKTEPTPLSRQIKWQRLSGPGFQPSFHSLLFDVEPAWAPDGKEIVFSSARSGKPMIYIVNLDSMIARQLTFAGRYNSSPHWSPTSNKIVFSAQLDRHFDVYLIDADGSNLTRVTFGADSYTRAINSENPSWAPTGRHIVFANNETGSYAVYVMSIDGTSKRRISPTDKECSMPSWSPYKQRG